MKKRLLKAKTEKLLVELDICLLKVKTCAQPTIVILKKVQSQVNQRTDFGFTPTIPGGGGFFAQGIYASKLSAGIIALTLFEDTTSTHKVALHRQVRQSGFIKFLAPLCRYSYCSQLSLLPKLHFCRRTTVSF